MRRILTKAIYAALSCLLMIALFVGIVAISPMGKAYQHWVMGVIGMPWFCVDYRINDVIEWEVPRGIRRLKIKKVLYQPESAGDFHL